MGSRGFPSAPEAGKIKVGTDGRILLDAYPSTPIPAKVSFIASQAQFTPKTVETQSERDKRLVQEPTRLARNEHRPSCCRQKISPTACFFEASHLFRIILRIVLKVYLEVF